MLEELWQHRRSGEESAKENDPRNPYEHDYGRVIHSAAFRRLQNKTQVLGLGDSDFYRTRLTHSMEVAQVGAGITTYLSRNTEEDLFDIQAILPEDRLIQAICLAHDIGNPPFGHGGEIALNEMMHKHGGFEGNGQTLRILSKLENYSNGFGMDPTRRMLLGVLKYPASYCEACNEEAYSGGSNPKRFKPPKCYLDDELDVVEWILEPLEKSERKLLTSCFPKEEGKHLKTRFKSLDTSIMELADDISYGVHDLEDAVSLRLITEKNWNETLEGFKSSILNDLIDLGKIRKDLFSEREYLVKHAIGELVHFFISNSDIVEQNPGFETPLLKYIVTLNEDARKLLEFLTKLVQERVIASQTVQLLEFKGQKIIKLLFSALNEDPGSFLNESARKKYSEAPNEQKMRVLCDYVAGMTDEYAARLYSMIFQPRSGSVFDRL